MARMNYLMGSRQLRLEDALEAYRQGAPLLVGSRQGQFTSPSLADDPGLYLTVPPLADALGISVKSAAILTWTGFLALGLILSLWAWFRLHPSKLARGLGTVGLFAVFGLASWLGDTYSMLAAAPLMGVLPTLAVLGEKTGNEGLSPSRMAAIALLGVALGVSNAFRGHSGTAVAIFVAAIIASRAWTRRQRLIALIIFGLCVLAPSLGTRWQSGRSEDFIRRQQPDRAIRQGYHLFWHSVYIGFGYLKNPHGIEYVDACGRDRVRAIDPQVAYCSPEYEAILRREVFALVAQDPVFVAQTLLAKLGKTLLFVLIFANAGLWAAWRYPLPRAWVLGFAASGAFESLFGVLVMPTQNYLLGLIAFSAIFGILALGRALEAGAWEQLKESWARRRR